MKNFIKFFAILGIIAVGVACENRSSNDGSQPASAPAAETSPAPETLAADVPVAPSAALVATGNAVTTSTVVDRHSTVGETPAGSDAMTWDEIIATYPVLADRIIFLGSIDKVVETDARTIDLYSAGAVVMTLKYNEAGDALAVQSTSHAGFAADLISFESSAAQQSQGAVVESLDFMMSSCNTVEAPQEQEQAQEAVPSKEQEQAGKEQEQAGKEAPVKEEPKKEEPKQECASIVASLVLNQVVEKVEQKQEITQEPKKEEPKQEVKEEPKAPEQEQAQEGKAPEQQDKT